MVSPYDAEIVKRIKQLPRRQWDQESRTWLVPLDYAGEVLEDLSEFGFEVDDSVRRAAAKALLALNDPAARPALETAAAEDPDAYVRGDASLTLRKMAQ